jgi:hypothetical protein
MKRILFERMFISDSLPLRTEVVLERKEAYFII